MTVNQKEPEIFICDIQSSIVESESSKHENLNSIKHSGQKDQGYYSGRSDEGSDQNHISDNDNSENQIIHKSNLELQEKEINDSSIEKEKISMKESPELSKITEEHHRLSTNEMNSNKKNHIIFSVTSKNINPTNLEINSSDQIAIKKIENFEVIQTNLSNSPKIITNTEHSDPLHLNKNIQICDKKSLAIVNSDNFEVINNSLAMLNNSKQQGLQGDNTKCNIVKLAFQKKWKSWKTNFVGRRSRFSKGNEESCELDKNNTRDSRRLSSSKHIVRYRKMGNFILQNKNMCLIKESVKTDIKDCGAEQFSSSKRPNSTPNRIILDNSKHMFMEKRCLTKGNAAQKETLAKSININTKHIGSQNVHNKHLRSICKQYIV